MRNISWNLTKNKRLKRARGTSFEELLQGQLIDIIQHTAKEHQDVLIIYYKNYIWAVPFVESKNGIFLKTLYPSRKYKKIYLKGDKNEKNEINKV